jgi:hypothetical protein
LISGPIDARIAGSRRAGSQPVRPSSRRRPTRSSRPATRISGGHRTNGPEGEARLLQTITTRTEGAVLFAEIAAPPMNLLGPELVRDIVSLVRNVEGDDALKVVVVNSADHDYFISHVDLTRVSEYRAEAAVLTGRSIDRIPLPLSEFVEAGHDCADRRARSGGRQRIRVGM